MCYVGVRRASVVAALCNKHDQSLISLIELVIETHHYCWQIVADDTFRQHARQCNCSIDMNLSGQQLALESALMQWPTV